MDSNSPRNIVMVEDDELIRENYAEILRDEGYQVQTYSESEPALSAIQAQMPDLVILDIGLGKDRYAGYQLCNEIRRLSNTVQIVFLTSHESDADKISGMRLGADDYMTKDISMNYLVVRLDALFRRLDTLRQSAARDGHDTGSDRSDGLKLDADSCVAYWNDQRVDLSLTQFWILQELANKPGQVKSPTKLMAAANIIVETNTIAAHIKIIRKKFKEIDEGFNMIKAEYAAGYRWLSE